MNSEYFRFNFRKVYKALLLQQCMMQLNIGAKGEIVIPKKIREQLGLVKERKVILEVKDKVIYLHTPSDGEEVVKEWEGLAKKYKFKASDLIYGDKLYEEVF